MVILGIDDFQQLPCEPVDRAQERQASQAEGNQHHLESLVEEDLGAGLFG